jgi:hypothetical protein
MSPHRYSGGPIFTNGGSSGKSNITLDNGISEIDMTPGLSVPNLGVTWRRSFLANEVEHEEFDIQLNANVEWEIGDAFGELGANAYDIDTALRHELGHAVGLDESNNAGRLMYEGITTRTVLNIGSDEKAGYRCIFDSQDCDRCQGSNCPGLDLEIYLTTKTHTERKSLFWSLQSEREDIAGFNIYEKTVEKGYVSLNTSLIPSSDPFYQHEFTVGSLKGKYYLEIVYVGGSREIRNF